MNKGMSSPIVLLLSRIISPYIMLFGLYVIFHGHYGPGGGFQGGALLAASILLIRIAIEGKAHELHFNKSLGIPLASLGVIIFIGVGAISIVYGGYFLDYHLLPIPGLGLADLRSTGILIVETGIGLAVMAVLVSIYDNLMEADDD